MENISTRMLPTKLTKDEIVDRAELMAKKMGEVDSLNEQLKAATGGLKSKIKGLTKEIGDLSRLINSGKEDRETECRTDRDWDHKEIVVTRLDTGEEIERRTMTLSEAQADLLDRGAKPGKLLSLDGGKAEDGAGEAAQGATGENSPPVVSEDERPWRDPQNDDSGTFIEVEEAIAARAGQGVSETQTSLTDEERAQLAALEGDDEEGDQDDDEPEEEEPAEEPPAETPEKTSKSRRRRSHAEPTA